MEKTIKSSAINYGIYLGLFLSLTSVLVYVINLELLTKWWLGIILFLVIIAFGIVSTAKAKSLLDGFISFKQAFSSYFITVAIGVLISMVVGILLYNVIDPDAAIVLKEKIVESTTQMMEGFGAPQSEIDKAITKLQEQDQFSIVSQLQSVAFQLIFYAVVGLIVALIMKKSDPNVA